MKFYLSDEERRALRRRAADLDVTLTALIRAALESI
jgi:hypothetical protein